MSSISIPSTRVRLSFAGVLLLAACLCLRAQITVEEEVITDSVDVFATPEQSGKSPQLAMLGSILIPGLGQQYLGKQQRALAYFTAEALFLAGAIFCEQYSQRHFRDARSYARTYAWAEGGAGADEAYWRNLTQYMDAEGYNHVQELNRTPEHKYVERHLQWQWIDESFMERYSRIWENATRFHVASSFLIGAMVLNRVISFVDARTATRYRGVQGSAALRVYPEVASDLSSVGLRISHRF